MLLDRDAPVVVFMNKKHPLMTSPTWKKQLKDFLSTNPYEPLNLQSMYYFGFQMNVSRNIYRDGISNGVYTKKELLHNCTMRGGYGLTMELFNGHQQLITFHDFMTNCNSLLIYSCSCPRVFPRLKRCF